MEAERKALVGEAMRRAGYSVLVCRLPQHVVLLTGYQPILGDSFCVVSRTKDGDVEARLTVASGDEGLVPSEAATAVNVFAEASLKMWTTTLDAAKAPLQHMLVEANIGDGALVGYEGGRAPVAVAYTQVGVPGPSTRDLLGELLPQAKLRDASAFLEELSAVKTNGETQAIRRCERVAVAGFQAAREAVRVGASEADVAAAATAGLLRAGYAAQGAKHVLPFVHVMAGTRAYNAYKAFNLTSNAPIERGDPVLVQMEIGINGYWAELTRTFFAEEISDEWRRAHDACVRAHEAALKAIRPGITGHDADEAARAVMREAGFGDAFKHALGHGFGFQAINHSAHPVLHPASQQVLAPGMISNMEPAVYLQGKGGIRLNDDILVREDGCELLSADLPHTLDWLVVRA